MDEKVQSGTQWDSEKGLPASLRILGRLPGVSVSRVWENMKEVGKPSQKQPGCWGSSQTTILEGRREGWKSAGGQINGGQRVGTGGREGEVSKILYT